MKKAEDLGTEERIRKHVIFSKSLFDKLKDEALEGHGGNHSLLIRKILRERYKDDDED